MQAAVRSKAVVQPGGRIEVTNDELPVGKEVDVIVLVESESSGKRSALEILEGLPGQRLFKSAAEVDEYIRAERDSWER